MKTTTIYRLAGSRQANRNAFWFRIASFYNRMPLGITPCKNTYEAKMYTAVLFAAFTFAFPPCILIVVYLISNRNKKN